MQISRKNDNKNRQVNLTLVFTEEETAPFFIKGANIVSKQVNIPGYRKGKATKELLEQYGYGDRIFRESLNLLLPEKINEALSTEKIKPFYDPQFEKIDRDPLTIHLLIPIEPKVNLPEYSAISVKRNETKITVKEINKTIEDMKDQSNPWESIEGIVELNKLVNIDVHAKIEEQDVISQKGVELLLNSEEILVPGFKESLLGMSPKQQKRFVIDVPKEHSNKQIAGKTLNFRVLLREIKEKKVKELNDNLAVDLGYSDLKDMKKKVKDRLLNDASQRDKQQYQEELFTAILEKSSFIVSPLLIEMEKEQLKKEKLAQQNTQNVSTAVEEETKPEEDIDKEINDEVNARFKNTLVMREVSKQQKIEITEEDINQELKRIFPDNSIDKIGKNRDIGRIRNSVRNNMLRTRILNSIETLVDKKVEKPANNSSKEKTKVSKKKT